MKIWFKLKRPKRILSNWYDKHRHLNKLSNSEIFALKQFIRHYDMIDYGYEGDWKTTLEYCSDRMNGGRAKSILRLYKDS